MKERDIFKFLEKWVIYAIYVLLIIVFMSWWKSCQSNREDVRMKKEITTLYKEVDSLNNVLNNFMDVVATKHDIKKDNEEQMSRFLYWEREADKPQYKDYTPRDYEELIKEK